MRPIKMTWKEFTTWYRQRSQWTENIALNPHNPDVADSEIVDVFEELDVLRMMRQLVNGKIVITDIEKEIDK